MKTGQIQTITQVIKLLVKIVKENNMLQWHRKQTEKWQKKFNVDAYGLAGLLI